MAIAQRTAGRVAASVALAAAFFVAASIPAYGGRRAAASSGEVAALRAGDVVGCDGLGSDQAWRVAGVLRARNGAIAVNLVRGDECVTVDSAQIRLGL